jgi:hypothetical protein
MTFETMCVACGRRIEHGNFMYIARDAWACKRPCWKLWKALGFPSHNGRPDWDLVFGRAKIVGGERTHV